MQTRCIHKCPMREHPDRVRGGEVTVEAGVMGGEREKEKFEDAILLPLKIESQSEERRWPLDAGKDTE